MNVTIMIGVVGAGKTTLAKELTKHPNTEIISFDDIYAEFSASRFLTPKYNCFKRNMVLKEMQNRLQHLLSQNKNVVIDYTNLPTSRRLPFVKIAREFNANLIANIILVDDDICIKQMELREKEPNNLFIIPNKEKTLKLYNKRLLKTMSHLEKEFNIVNTYLNHELVSTENPQ